MRAKPEKCDEVMAALAAIIPGTRATEGVVRLDIARDLLDPDSLVATGVYEDGAAIERQESAPEVHRAWRCLLTRWPLRPIDGSMTRRATRPTSKFDRGCQP